MKLRVSSLIVPALPLLLAACGTRLLQPSSTSSGVTTNGVTNSSASTPALMAPADGAKLAYASQPFTLVVGNAVSTSASSTTYTFEVATDAAFSSVVYRKSGVPQGAGQTSLTIDKLAASSTFFWRAHAVSGSDNGPNPKGRSFTVGAQVVLQTPVPISPPQNGVATGSAALTVANVQRSGPAGPITYLFQLSGSSSFSNILFSSNVPEQGGGRTSTLVNIQLATGQTYYWRAQASDAANFVTTEFSTPFAFKFSTFDMAQATIWDNDPLLGKWPATAQITSIVFTDASRYGQFTFDFDKRTGPGRWPDVPFGFPGNSLQFTLGMCLNIKGHWNCSAAIQYWFGRPTIAPNSIAANWFYDARWGPMAGYQPANGEEVGIFVAAGNLRGVKDGSGSRVYERSNVVLLPFGGHYP